MLRQRENPDSFKAGVLSISVHAILLGALLISFNWKTTHPISVAEVELWDSLPTANVAKPEPVLPIPEVKEPPKPEPEPMIEPKPEPEPKLVPEIAIKQEAPKKPIKKEPLKEPPKKEIPKKVQQDAPSLADIKKQIMQEALDKPNKPPVDDVLKKIQQDSLSDTGASSEPKASAAKAGEVDEFKAKIQTKIRNNVNKSLCGDGNPELKFDIALLPTGELSAAPKLTKSSGNPTCDEAVERAIRASEPLPLPTDKTLFSQFRLLKLTFRPNKD
ncbi:MAG: protein TolA [Methylotenera sp.]|uniref:cell envelope integrity protein TolA n=1 Tax=Methylotenera sp. TaxID=2051956 RepID=UPI000D48423F|nr:cell envelope integrity protein TolA [Methylotenera sp.]PPC84511.1 MAG: protein TolA [Methylotenera sp.]